MIIPLLITTAAAITVQQAPSLEQQVSRLWNSLSNAPQSKPDIATLQQLFISNATVAGVRYKNGAPGLNLQQASEFIAGQDRVKPYGFYECEIAREVRASGNFATVLSLVESRRDAAQPQADFTGINSMQWANIGSGWQLVSLYYYLPSENGSVQLLSGTTGQCLNHEKDAGKQ